MPKEIKFRGKRLSNGEWVYGGYHKHQKVELSPVILKDKNTPKPEYAHLIIQSSFADWNMPKPLKEIEVAPATVGQYTGYKDKNGVEIYEGDVVKNVVGEKFIVDYWAGKWAGFVLESADGEYLEGYLGEYFPSSNHLEIIGNIHDNPELLEGDK